MKRLVPIALVLGCGQAMTQDAPPEPATAVLPALTLRMPVVLDLPDALELALEYNPGLKRLRAQVEEQDGALEEIRSARRLKFDVSGGYTAFDERRLQAFGPGIEPEETRWNGGVETSATIYSGGQSRAAYQSAEHLRRALLDQITAGERDLLARVREAWLDAELARETLKVRTQAIDVFEEQLDFVRKRYEAGAGARFDVKQAEVALANARPGLIRAENDYRRNIDALRMAIGLPYPEGRRPSEIRLKPSGPTPPVDMQVEESIAAAMRLRPELSELEARIAAQERQVRRERLRNRPLVDLFAGYGAESDQFGGTDALRGWTGGVRLNWRFSDGGATRGKVRQAASRLRQLLYQHQETMQRIEGEVRQGWFDYEQAQAILRATELAIEEAEEALELARNRFKAGRGTQLEVLESQLQLTRARLEQADSNAALERAIIRIRRAAGLDL